MSRAAVYNKYGGRCAYCGKQIHKQAMQVDHIHPKMGYIETDENGNKLNPNRIENLNPACKSCNNYKSMYSIEEFRGMLKQLLNDKPDYLFRSRVKADLAQKYGAITVDKWDGMFYFEKVKLMEITYLNYC